MIYVDTSVALAHLLSEDRRPPSELWAGEPVASRLLEYELWTRVHARDLTRSHSDLVHRLVSRVSLVEMIPAVLSRALEPFPVSVRTLDALHLATASFLRERGYELTVASYDARLNAAAEAIGFELYEA